MTPETIPAVKFNKAQLCDRYGVGRRTLAAWLAEVPELGEYKGRCYTVAQTQKILAHLEGAK